MQKASLKTLTLIATLVTLYSTVCIANNISVIMASKIKNIDPVHVLNNAEMLVIASYCRPLVRINQQGALEGELVRSWNISKDFLKYTFHLKKGIKFHDDTELTSADVQFSLSRHFWKKYDSGHRYHLAFATGSHTKIRTGSSLPNIKIIDRYTFTFTLDQPYIPFLKMLSQTSLCIVKKNKPLVGSGPMQIRADGTYAWILDRKGNIDKTEFDVNTISFKTLSDYENGITQFRNKKVDLVIGSQFAKHPDAEGLTKYKMDFLSINHFFFNSKRGPLKSLELRSALGRYIQEIAWRKQNIGINQEVSKSLIPTGFFSNSKVKSKLNFEEAKNKLSEFKHRIKRPLKIYLVKALFSESFLSDLKSELQTIGIPFDLKLLKGPDWSQIFNEGNFDITHYPAMPSFYDPDGIFYFLQDFFRTDQRKAFDLLTANRHISNKKKRHRKYINALSEIENEWVIVPTYRDYLLYLKGENVIIPDTLFRNEFQAWKIKK